VRLKLGHDKTFRRFHDVLILPREIQAHGKRESGLYTGGLGMQRQVSIDTGVRGLPRAHTPTLPYEAALGGLPH
jgi:hypothetical protein